MTTRLFVIDPQLDFCDGPAKGALAVSGTWQDMQRLAGYVDRESAAIDEAFISLDSHHAYDIGHPTFWRGPEGEAPAPFSLISATDVRSGRWIPTNPARLQQTSDYLEALEAKGRYRHTVWPTHCLVGTPGHAIQPDLMAALNR
jgi:nicotinamidase-related amidase